MIHNKYLMILKQYLGDYNKEIYGRNIVNKVALSQKAIALTLDELEKEGILKSRKQGNIKYFKLNIPNPNTKDLLSSAEMLNKTIFFNKNKKLHSLFKKDDRIIGVFGSYAKGTETKSSDIDLFIIGDKLKNDYDKKGELFDLKISIKYFPERKFIELIKDKNNLCKEIIENHITIFNVEKFISIVWGDYYGFD